MASKGFIIVGIISFYILLSILLSYAGFEYSAMAGFDFSGETTFEVEPATSAVNWGNIFTLLFGIFTFSIVGMPFILNIILWLPGILMGVIIYEMIRGYG